MIFLEPRPGKKSYNLKQLNAALAPLFKGNWEDNAREILAEMQYAANNYAFLNEYVHKAVKSNSWPKMQGAQSFLVHEGEHYFIRINLWFPPRVSPVEDQIKKYFSIELLHNHNFPLFTVGLFGPGYITRMSWWDDPDPNREVGEKLDIKFEKELSLPLGAALYMKKDNDFHMQLWPKGFSISLNVIPSKPEDSSKIQYVLNHDLTIREKILAGVNPLRAA